MLQLFVGNFLSGTVYMFSLDADSAISLSPLLFVCYVVFLLVSCIFLFDLKVIHPRSVYKINQE